MIYGSTENSFRKAAALINRIRYQENGGTPFRTVNAYCENFDGGTKAPMFMVRKGKFKYISCSGQPALLYDIDEDPNELNNLSGKTEFKEIEEVLLAKVNKRWNTKKMTAHIIQNQQQRGFVHKALSKGTHTGWDYVPAPDTFTSYRPKVQNYYGWFGNKV